jgi:hypothetical protein
MYMPRNLGSSFSGHKFEFFLLLLLFKNTIGGFPIVFLSKKNLEIRIIVSNNPPSQMCKKFPVVLNANAQIIYLILSFANFSGCYN